MTTISLGAINKKTGEYIYPKVANKKDEYYCPECHKELIICQGNIRIHHFRHSVDAIIPCHHYSSPTESQIHKDAKLLLKTILERKINISFIRKCFHCRNDEEFEIPLTTDASSIKLEYSFEFNGPKIADVAYIDNGEIICIFEICHTHKTKSENRPEPWFEIDAVSLIENVNDINLCQVQINCIRSKKCDECIQQENDNIEKKKHALDILYNWFQSGIEVSPFYYGEDKFAGIKKNVKCEYIDELFDLILYTEPTEKYERYCIRLINNSNYYFTEELEYACLGIGVYYINIDWVLFQKEIPQFIKYIACLDCYDKDNLEKICINCKLPNPPFWVKRINTISNYKVIYIGSDCCDKNHNTEYINCERCNSVGTPLCVMETNKINKKICKSCDIDLFSSGNIYLSVSFSEKDEVKKLGAYWDSKCKKWFIHKNHKNIDIVLQKYKRLW
jgi:uncharacterized protein YkuJ